MNKKEKFHNKKRFLRVSVRERVVEGWLSEEKLTDGRVHRDSEREPGKLNLKLRKNNYWKVFYRKSPCKLHTFILPYGSSCSNREGKKRNNPWNILGTFYFFFLMFKGMTEDKNMIQYMHSIFPSFLGQERKEYWQTEMWWQWRGEVNRTSVSGTTLGA